MILIVTPVSLVLDQMQEICFNNELISSIGIARLITKGYYETHIVDKRIYAGGITSTTVLPSTEIRYEREKEIRSMGHALYRYREYITEEVPPPSISPSLTIYMRSYKYKNNGYIMVVSLTTTVYPNNIRVEGGSICIILEGREKKEDMDRIVLDTLYKMYKISLDRPSITIDSMISSVSRWKLHLPSYRRLRWIDISMSLFRQSVMVDIPIGKRVFYIRSPSGTFMIDEWNRTTPIDTATNSLSILIGIYNTVFHPIDIWVDKDVDIRTYSYEDKIPIIRGYGLSLVTLVHPNTPNDFYSFVIGKESMAIFSPTTTYIWESHIHERVYIGAGGIPMVLDGMRLESIPITIDKSNMFIGEMVYVYKKKILSISEKAAPMTRDRVSSLLQEESDIISMDDLSGRTCTLFSKHIEKIIFFLYSYYRSMGITSVLDISSDIGHSYWRTSGITTYAMTDTPSIEKFKSEYEIESDGNSIFWDNWDVEIVSSIGSVPMVQATDIIRTSVTVDQLDAYSSISSTFVSMMSTDDQYRRLKDHMEKWGWYIDTEYKIEEELLPLDPTCTQPLSLYIWKRYKEFPEVIRLVYTPVQQGIISKVESPYGTLYREGTAGSTTSGRDDSLIESIYLASSPEYRRKDKIGKVLYVLSHREPKIHTPLYLIPPDSWDMYYTQGSRTYIYNYQTPRVPGIVLFKNKGHWEPLAKKNVSGQLQYIW